MKSWFTLTILRLECNQRFRGWKQWVKTVVEMWTSCFIFFCEIFYFDKWITGRFLLATLYIYGEGGGGGLGGFLVRVEVGF